MKPRTAFEKMRRNRARRANCVSTAQLREEAIAFGYDDTDQAVEHLMRAPQPKPQQPRQVRRWWHGLNPFPGLQRS